MDNVAIVRRGIGGSPLRGLLRLGIDVDVY